MNEVNPKDKIEIQSVSTGTSNDGGGDKLVSENKFTSETDSQSKKPYVKRTHRDFIWGKLIGEGSFSMVYLAKDTHTNKDYAIKVCEKQHILREKKQKYITREKEVLDLLNQNTKQEVPFFVKLYFTFQDASRLYFVLSYLPRGELTQYINNAGTFDAEITKFYSGEILLALEHLHSLGIIHRDLKPENILLSKDFHICITDFGSAKITFKEDKDSKRPDAPRRSSFVGTAQYVSPEILHGEESSYSSDLWAFGCVIYQMVCGVPPFRGTHEFGIFQKITKVTYDFPEDFDPRAKLLIGSLLVFDPKGRLGASDLQKYKSLRTHQYFEDVEFDSLYLQRSPLLNLFSHLDSQNTVFEVPKDIQPGLDDKQMNRLLGLDLYDSSSLGVIPPRLAKSLDSAPAIPAEEKGKKKPGLMDFTKEQEQERVQVQAQNNPWHEFVEGKLILKQGLIDKRKGLFARRRMFLLTTGPRLFYVDPVNKVLKGEVPWSKQFSTEMKTFKTFYIHTTNRTYYLEDPSYHASEWCKALDEVWKHSFGGE